MVSDDMLRHITTLFPEPEHQYLLDKSYEPTEAPRNACNEAIFERLQNFRAAGLIEPVGTQHMYYAALESKTCQLTALGRAYWHQVKNQRF